MYSRPVYFCLCCVMIWIFNLSASSGNLQSFSLYGVTFFSVDFLLCVRDMLIGRFYTNFLTLLRLCEMLMASFLSVPQCLPCVSRLFSSLGCYLRSIPLWCVCWSRLICTFLVEVVRVIPFQDFWFKCSFWNLSWSFFLPLCFLSYYQPTLISI